MTLDRYCVRAKRISPSRPDSRSQRANFEKRVVTQLERDNRPHAGGAHGVPDANELAFVEPGRLLEHDVLAGPCRRHGLVGVQMVRRRDRDDVDVVGREQVFVAGGDAHVGQRQAVLLEGLPDDPCGVAAVQPGNGCVGILQKCGDVLGAAPADARHANAKFSITRMAPA